ncbi:hypothetical protein PLICRDRAFT_31726 [Plicaturopsis crispa FD-325 SS-3]|nr:hypothetical protein PLICRDRAFT_31726 [Plicaturopsis crispa FD-325 SS-3]
MSTIAHPGPAASSARIPIAARRGTMTGNGTNGRTIKFRKVQEDAIRLTLFNFDSDTAWDLGSAIRTITEATGVDKPVSISITHANSDQPMFYASSAPGVTPDHMQYVECMRNAVKRWGKPTKYLNLQTPNWNARTPEAWHAGYTDLWHQKYAFFSGGWPIKVTGVEGVVAVVVMYGSAADPYGHDHDSNHTLILRGPEQIIRDQQ